MRVYQPPPGLSRGARSAILVLIAVYRTKAVGFMEFFVRPMALEDYDELYALWMSTEGMGLRQGDDGREGIERFLARNPGCSFVARASDGALLGGILCGHDGRRGHIYHTAVAQSARKQGVGRALVGRAMDALRAQGIRKATLVAFARNELGNAFWQRMGFAARGDLTYRDAWLNKTD